MNLSKVTDMANVRAKNNTQLCLSIHFFNSGIKV